MSDDARKSYMTRSDVARLLQVSPNTVTRWAHEGRIPCQLTLGGHHRFDPDVVMKLVDELSRSGDNPNGDKESDPA